MGKAKRKSSQPAPESLTPLLAPLQALQNLLPFEYELVERSEVVEVGPIKLRLPTPEDLIILKAVARRPKDIADIQAIAASHPSLDKARIRYWLEQFGEVLEALDLWESTSQLL